MTKNNTKLVWFIERVSSENGRWLQSTNAPWSPLWTDNPNAAKQFPSRNSAQVFINLSRISLANAFPSEHLFMDTTNEKPVVMNHEFQVRVNEWMQACFGAEISSNIIERNHRFLEEALELVQACGCTQNEAHQLVDYVFNRPIGYPPQEVGGVMITLAAVCLANGFNMNTLGEIELKRVWTKVEEIRAKQASKPKHSPLPGITPTSVKGKI